MRSNGYGSVLAICAISALIATSSGAEEMASSATVGSAIVTTGDSLCQGGERSVQKALMIVHRNDDGEVSEVRTRTWMEATGETCEMTRGASDGGTEFPAASDDMKMALKEDAEKRAEAEGEQTRGYWCSDSCQYTRGQYECWYGNYYWVDYCYNECNAYTGQYSYWHKGYC